MDVMRDVMEDVFAKAKGVVGVGSPRASLEDNFALRHLVGTKNFTNGMSPADSDASLAARDTISAHADRLATLREVESCDAVLILGEDVTQTAPRLALALRQSRRNKHLEHAAANKIPKWHARAVRDIGQYNNSPIFSATAQATRLDDIVMSPQRLRPAAIAELGFAVAHALDNTAPEVEQLDKDTKALVDAIAATLKSAKKPLIVVGTGLGDPAILKAAANVTRAVAAANEATRLFVTLSEANSLGMAMLEERNVDHALTAIEDGSADTLVVMQNCLYERAHQGPRGCRDQEGRACRGHGSQHDAHRGRSRPTCCRPAALPRPTARWSTTKGAPSASSRSSSPMRRCRKAGAGPPIWPRSRVTSPTGSAWTT